MVEIATKDDLAEIIAPMLAELQAFRSAFEAQKAQEYGLYMTTSEAAKVLRITEATMRRRRAQYDTTRDQSGRIKWPTKQVLASASGKD